jgi:hypothetical protein
MLLVALSRRMCCSRVCSARRCAGFPSASIEVVPELQAALDRGLELAAAGSDLVALPTYTAMLALRDLVARRGFVRQYWEAA